jgi:hypothetical protein
VSFTPTGTVAASPMCRPRLPRRRARRCRRRRNLSDLASAVTARANIGVSLANKGGVLVGSGAAIVELPVVEARGPRRFHADERHRMGADYPRSLAPNPFFSGRSARERGDRARRRHVRA